MPWRLMWYPALERDFSSEGVSFALASDEIADERDAKAVVMRLKNDGLRCISVTEIGSRKKMRGRELAIWLAETPGGSRQGRNVRADAIEVKPVC